MQGVFIFIDDILVAGKDTRKHRKRLRTVLKKLKEHNISVFKSKYHKPLLAILGPKASLPTLVAARLQCWAITLAAYPSDIEYRPTSNMVKQFALQLDESTLRDNEAILLAYVRFNSDEGHKEELLFARSLVTDTKGETIFNEVVTYFQQNNIPLKNIIACATDGAPSMKSRYKGFIAHLKKAVPGNIFEKLNSLNKQLQGKDSDLISSRSASIAFLRKLQFYKNNIRRCAFKQFPCLVSISRDLQDEDLALYGEYMENMHKDMQIRFSDLLMMVIPTWVSVPFEVNVANIDISLQEPLIELQNDEIMSAKFKDGKYNVWKTNDVATKYPLLWDTAQIYVIAFPTSHLVESGFSRVSQLL
ncbi:SCAN domain-containing protein 3-like [Palaemon carinicauda]|uniref:SCAN domain-containing protein 3-like n=1 Tax=Palaemon carinicauda TaxID=392227 RepID=UPI0035B5BBB5